MDILLLVKSCQRASVPALFACMCFCLPCSLSPPCCMCACGLWLCASWCMRRVLCADLTMHFSPRWLCFVERSGLAYAWYCVQNAVADVSLCTCCTLGVQFGAAGAVIAADGASTKRCLLLLAVSSSSCCCVAHQPHNAAVLHCCQLWCSVSLEQP